MKGETHMINTLQLLIHQGMVADIKTRVGIGTLHLRHILKIHQVVADTKICMDTMKTPHLVVDSSRLEMRTMQGIHMRSIPQLRLRRTTNVHQIGTDTKINM